MKTLCLLLAALMLVGYARSGSMAKEQLHGETVLDPEAACELFAPKEAADAVWRHMDTEQALAFLEKETDLGTAPLMQVYLPNNTEAATLRESLTWSGDYATVVRKADGSLLGTAILMQLEEYWVVGTLYHGLDLSFDLAENHADVLLMENPQRHEFALLWVEEGIERYRSLSNRGDVVEAQMILDEMRAQRDEQELPLDG